MTIAGRVLKAIAKHAKGLDPQIDPSTDLHTLGDGATFHEIIMAVEDEFDCEIPDAVSETLKSTRDLIDLITTRAGVPA
jgi:acyl carrier protein